MVLRGYRNSKINFSFNAALLGAVLCIAGMFILQPLYASCAMVLFAILWSIIYYRGSPHDWCDLSQAIIYHQVWQLNVGL